MKHATGQSFHLLVRYITGPALAVLVLCLQACSSPTLKPWHTEKLTEEFTADMVEDGRVRNFDDYLALEDRLYRQLDNEVYAKTASGPAHELERYSTGSAADPEHRPINWNHSFELTSTAAVGGVLLLHGMSDSPYTLHALGETLNQHGYHVIGLRAPGHGTAPSGLRHIKWQDMAAAVKLAMGHLIGPEQLLGDLAGGPTGSSRLECERELYGFDHTQAGEALARLWMLPEIRDLLAEAGFLNINVWFEHRDEKGKGLGEWYPDTEGRADPAWVANISAEK